MIPSYTTDEVLRILHLSQQTFRDCLRAASYPPPIARKPHHFSFHDLVIVRTTKGLLEAGISVRRIRKILASLKRQLPDDHLLSGVKIFADGRRVVVWDATGQWQPDSGQFLLDFEAADVNRLAKVRTLARPREKPRSLAQQWYERAQELEEDSPDEARHAYQEALKIDPSFVDAHLNLGLLFHLENRLDEAEASYRFAIKYGPKEALGYFNLAGLLKQRGDPAGAIAAYTQAIQLQPDLTEAHEQLARLYDAEGNTTMAFRHGSACYQLKKPRSRAFRSFSRRPRQSPPRSP